MDTIECLMTRRSVRKYKKEQVDEETLKKILDAGTMAPSAMGKQSATMVVVRDPVTIKALSKMNAAIMGVDSDPFYGAPTVVLVFGNPKVNRNYVRDASLVMGNLMNAAHALGVDSCWINRGKEMFEDADGKAFLREWGASEDLVGIGICILGYGDGTCPAPAPRKEDYIIYAE
ncbi:MAG TPA: nitroreductase [Lachnospiraceae bacterium]|nr:nitroreductase [Lachnospiraceae bacterium]